MLDAAHGDVGLSWLVVSHESADDLAVLLPQLVAVLAELAHAGFRSELIVVDNGSTDRSAAVVRRLAPGAAVIELEENLGYGAALNRAAANARGRWLACCNADLAVAPEELAALPGALRSAAREVGLLGPALHDGRGVFQPSAGSFPTLRRLLQRLPRPARSRPYLSRGAHRAGRVDWVTGACVFVRNEVFRAIGGFDEAFFLYYEDVDLAARALQRGWTTHYAPTIRVAHLRPHAGRARVAAIEGHVRDGRTLWFERHRPAAERRLLRMLTRVEPLLRGAAPRAAPRDADTSDRAAREAGGA